MHVILDQSVGLPPTWISIFSLALGKWAAINQSPGVGSVIFTKVLFCRELVNVTVLLKDERTLVLVEKLESRGLITGGAP
ncbi:hypothetical protein FKM82_020049 [Ascaphus truei]